MSTEAPTDDLNKPLGQKPKKRRRFVVPLPLVIHGIVGVLGLCVAVLLGWILFVDDPFGGEPMVVISADTRASPQPARSGEAPQAPGPAAQKPDAVAPPTALADGERPSGAKTVTIIDGTTGKRQEVTVGQPGGPPATKASGPRVDTRQDVPIDPRLLENSRHGAIPKVAPDGARPAETYARPVKPQAGRADQPRVAIVIEGLGIGANSTSEALARMPAPVTFAFAPYGTDLERWVARARRRTRGAAPDRDGAVRISGQ